MSLAFLSETMLRLLSGVPLTLELTGLSLVFGGLLALLLAGARLSRRGGLSHCAEAYVFVFRGTPLLVQIYLIYYGLGQFRPELQAVGLWWFFREPFWCALLALALNTAAYTSEVVRSSVIAIPPGQIEAARACGMSFLTRLRRVILPLALRQALPAYGNEIILMVKSTSLVSTITMMEITGIAQKLISDSFRPIEILICAGAVYLAINFIASRLIALADRQLSWPMIGDERGVRN